MSISPDPKEWREIPDYRLDALSMLISSKPKLRRLKRIKSLSYFGEAKEADGSHGRGRWVQMTADTFKTPVQAQRALYEALEAVRQNKIREFYEYGVESDGEVYDEIRIMEAIYTEEKDADGGNYDITYERRVCPIDKTLRVIK